MDVENLLAKTSDSLSVRRAFGTAYEKDGMLIIPVVLVAGMVEGAPAVAGAGPDGLGRGRPGPAPLHPELTSYRSDQSPELRDGSPASRQAWRNSAYADTACSAAC